MLLLFLEVHDLQSRSALKNSALSHDDAKLEGIKSICHGEVPENSLGSYQITEL
jgi:hypothetical protein